jgi:hypothetical protein
MQVVREPITQIRFNERTNAYSEKGKVSETEGADLLQSALEQISAAPPRWNMLKKASRARNSSVATLPSDGTPNDSSDCEEHPSRRAAG